jgi:hypothetical protein
VAKHFLEAAHELALARIFCLTSEPSTIGGRRAHWVGVSYLARAQRLLSVHGILWAPLTTPHRRTAGAGQSRPGGASSPCRPRTRDAARGTAPRPAQRTSPATRKIGEPRAGVGPAEFSPGLALERAILALEGRSSFGTEGTSDFGAEEM